LAEIGAIAQKIETTTAILTFTMLLRAFCVPLAQRERDAFSRA
jgi:hypothetical protein